MKLEPFFESSLQHYDRETVSLLCLLQAIVFANVLVLEPCIFNDLRNVLEPETARALRLSFPPSFLPSFVPSFLRSFLPSFLPSFLRSFVPSFLPSHVREYFLDCNIFLIVIIFFDIDATLHYITVQYSTWHTYIHTYIHTLHYITLHHITLRYFTLIYTHTHIHTYIHTYRQTDIHTYI